MHIYFPVLTDMYHFFLHFCLWYEVFIDFFSTWLFTLWFSEDNCNDKSCAFEQLVLNAVTVHGEFALELCLLSYSMLSPSIWLGSFFSFLWAGKLLTILHYNFLRAQEMKPVHSFSNKKINGKKIPFLFKNVGLMSVNTCVQIYIHFFFFNLSISHLLEVLVANISSLCHWRSCTTVLFAYLTWRWANCDWERFLFNSLLDQRALHEVLQLWSPALLQWAWKAKSSNTGFKLKRESLVSWIQSRLNYFLGLRVGWAVTWILDMETFKNFLRVNPLPVCL